MKITQIDCSTTEIQIVNAIATYGGCLPADIKVGEIRYSQRGNGSVIAQCPAKVANGLVELGRIKLGWSVARVELMPQKINRCFKCWETGHFINNCKSTVDRSFDCFNCGEMGHKTKDCTERSSCPICKSRNKPYLHQCGRTGCSLLTETDANRDQIQRRTTGRRPGPQDVLTSERKKNDQKTYLWPN